MKEFFSKNLAIIITIIVLVAIVVGAIVLKLVLDKKNNKADETKTKIEAIVKDYISGINSFDTEKILKTIDLKAAYAYEQVQGDLSKFNETYKSAKDEDVKNFEADLKSELDVTEGFYKDTLDSFKMEFVEVENISEVPEVEGMYKAKVKETLNFAYKGTDMKNDVEQYYYIFNDKVIYDEEAVETESDGTEEKTNENTEESGNESVDNEKEADEKPAA